MLLYRMWYITVMNPYIISLLYFNYKFQGNAVCLLHQQVVIFSRHDVNAYVIVKTSAMFLCI